MKVHLRKTRFTVALCLFLVSLLFIQRAAKADPGNLFVHFIDVGQGDAIWLHLPDGDNVLVDGGLPQAGPTVVAYLQQNGVTHLDLMIATHGDSDHIGGLLDVLDAMRVEEAWLDSWSCTTAMCLEMYQSLASHSVITALVRVSDTFTFGSVTALVLNPSVSLYSEENENSGYSALVRHDRFPLDGRCRVGGRREDADSWVSGGIRDHQGGASRQQFIFHECLSQCRWAGRGHHLGG